MLQKCFVSILGHPEPLFAPEIIKKSKIGVFVGQNKHFSGFFYEWIRSFYLILSGHFEARNSKISFIFSWQNYNFAKKSFYGQNI